MNSAARCVLWVALASVCRAAPAAPDRAPAATCDGPDWQQVVETADQALPARAVWLDRTRLRWPDAPSDGTFKLYHAQSPRIVAMPGAPVHGADGAIALTSTGAALPDHIAERFKYLTSGATLAPSADDLRDPVALHRGQVVLVREDAAGRVLDATTLQPAGALDDLFSSAAEVDDLGVAVSPRGTRFKLWAPTARSVTLCRYATGSSRALAADQMQFNATTGVWSAAHPRDLSGSYYSYVVDVLVPGSGIVRNRVTDPYSISLTTDSKRSYVADLGSLQLAPRGWQHDAAPRRVAAATDMVVYELHVRDFSIGDRSVPPAHRGKYLAFTDRGAAGMRHLRHLADAGVTDVHLLPVFDIASIPEAGCVTPRVPPAAPASDAQQAAVTATASNDCFNWGYDPLHYGAPEGSYASDAANGATRVREFRAMVAALHRAGLRVGMDVVYNHTAASGQHAQSVLDRIVPGYYQRLDADGKVETSTCCANTATEHRMMGKLLADTVLRWATQYHIDSFRFDLMAHQPRALMLALKARLRAATGRDIVLIGEGWNFGEVADNRRFRQASQLELNGSGIATFSDRARDAARGGGPGDGPERLASEQGWLNGLSYDPNPQATPHTRADLMRAADMLRVGLAGSLRSYPMHTHDGALRRLEQIAYAGQPAGYTSQPDEVVNYVDNHDNHTLFDIGVLKLPPQTSREDRARVQLLGAALTAFSQGIAYFHAGIETLRSKSLDRNSFDSGDWFNPLDWTLQDNGFGRGLPPKADNGSAWPLLGPLLADPRIKPSPREIAWTRDAFLDLLRIRASSTLFHLRSAAEIEQRLSFPNTGPDQIATLLAARLDGRGLAGARFQELLLFINVDTSAQSLVVAGAAGKPFALHPVLRSPGAADRRAAAQSRFDPADGRFTIPPRTAVVFVVD